MITNFNVFLIKRLPQKAGFPQEKMNEIHGAWFDPSNPVVKFGGKLRGDLCFNMMQVEEVYYFILYFMTFYIYF